MSAAISAATATSGVQSSVLPSGLTVISAPNASARSVAAGVYIGLAAAHEAPDQAGWSHLLEHLHLSNDATDPRSRRRLALISGMGAQFQAATTLEYTAYSLEVSRRFWHRASALVADAIARPALGDEAIERERRVVLEEVAMRQAGASRLAVTLHREIFAGTPFTKWVAELGGRPDSLARATSQSLGAWRDRGYVAGNAWIVVAGAISHDEAIAFAERLHLPAGPAFPYPVGLWRPHYGRRTVHSATPQTSLVLAWPTVPAGDPASTPLALVAQHLGVGSGSRLFSELRSRRGLAYAPSVEHTQLPGVGAFEFWAETSSGRAADELTELATAIVCDDWQTVRPLDLRRKIREIVGTYELALDTPKGAVEVLGEHYAPGRRLLAPDAFVAKLRAVRFEEFVEAWRAYLRPERVLIVREN